MAEVHKKIQKKCPNQAINAASKSPFVVVNRTKVGSPVFSARENEWCTSSAKRAVTKDGAYVRLPRDVECTKGLSAVGMRMGEERS